MAESVLADDGEDEGEPVTLCIASACEVEKRPAIVLCVDSLAIRGEATSAASVTDQDKIRWPSARSTILIAGKARSADDLIAVLAPAIKQYEAAHAGDDP